MCSLKIRVLTERCGGQKPVSSKGFLESKRDTKTFAQSKTWILPIEFVPQPHSLNLHWSGLYDCLRMAKEGWNMCLCSLVGVKNLGSPDIPVRALPTTLHFWGERQRMQCVKWESAAAFGRKEKKNLWTGGVKRAALTFSISHFSSKPSTLPIRIPWMQNLMTWEPEKNGCGSGTESWMDWW